jgi:WD40 repeat protein
MMKTKHLFLWLFLFILLATTTGTFAQDAWLPELEQIHYYPQGLELLARIGQGYPSDIEWSPDGSKIAVASSVGVWLYDAQDLEAEPQFFNSGTAAVTAMSISIDSRRLAFAGDRVYVWDIGERHLLQTIEVETGIISVAFNLDGTQIVTARGFYQGNHDVVIWDVETGEQVRLLDGGGIVADLVYSPDGVYVVGIQLGDCCFAVSIWDAATGEELYIGDIQVLADEHLPVFSPDSTTLAVVDRTGAVTLWDLATQTQRGVLLADIVDSSDYYPLDAAFSADGRQFMTLSKMGILRIWNVDSEEPIETIERQPAQFAAFSPDLSQTAVMDNQQQISISDTESGEITTQNDFLSINTPKVIFNQDGSRMAFVVNDEIWLCNMATGEYVAVLSGHEDDITDLVFSVDGSQLASSSTDGTIRFWSVESGTLDEIFLTLDTGITQIIFNQDVDLLVATDSTVQVFDLETGEARLMFNNAETGGVDDRLTFDGTIEDIAYDGYRIAVTDSGAIYIWTAQNSDGTWSEVHVRRSFYGDVYALEFVESFLLSAGGESTVIKWNLSNYEFAGVATTHNSWIYDIVVDSNRRLIASVGCAENVTSVWDGSLYCAGADLRLSDLYRINAPSIVPQGHKKVIRHVTFTSAGTLLATSSDDGTIILWGLIARDE